MTESGATTSTQGNAVETSGESGTKPRRLRWLLPAAVLVAWLFLGGPLGQFAGQLTDAASGLPVQGTVTAGPFSTLSGPATGSFDLMLPAGTYDVTASAEGYGSRTTYGVVAVSGDTTILDFVLSPFTAVFFDDVFRHLDKGEVIFLQHHAAGFDAVDIQYIID